jgi:hypothetical protein
MPTVLGVDLASFPDTPQIVTDTNTYNGKWTVLYFITDTQFNALTSNATGNDPKTFVWPAGSFLKGFITSFKLSSGSLVAY